MHAASETPHYRGIDTSIKLKLNVLEMKELLILLCCGDCEMITIQTMGYGSRWISSSPVRAIAVQVVVVSFS